jgi:hypothetical protein
LEGNAVLDNGARGALDAKIRTENLLFGKVMLVRRGKKIWHVLNFP